MNKLVLILILAGGAYYSLVYQSDMDKLMAVGTEQDGSGLEVINGMAGGYELSEFVEPGLITVVHLYDKTCPACVHQEKGLERLMYLRPDIAVKKIIINRRSRVSKGFVDHPELYVAGFPFVVLLDKEGRIIAANNGDDRKGYMLLLKWMNEEIDQENDRRRDEAYKQRAF